MIGAQGAGRAQGFKPSAPGSQACLSEVHASKFDCKVATASAGAALLLRAAAQTARAKTSAWALGSDMACPSTPHFGHVGGCTKANIATPNGSQALRRAVCLMPCCAQSSCIAPLNSALRFTAADSTPLHTTPRLPREPRAAAGHCRPLRPHQRPQFRLDRNPGESIKAQQRAQALQPP